MDDSRRRMELWEKDSCMAGSRGNMRRMFAAATTGDDS